MKLLKSTMLALALGAIALPAAFAQAAPDTAAEEAQVKAYAKMLRADLRKESQAIVDQAMALEAGQKAKFWGVYEGYQKEKTGLWDQRIANIKKYAASYEKMTDAVADDLANTALGIEAQQTAVRKKYYALMKTALGAKVAARFLQVENMLGQIAGLQINSEIPLIQ